MPEPKIPESLSNSLQTLVDLTSRIDERVKMLIENQSDSNDKIEKVMDKVSNVMSRLTVVESKNDHDIRTKIKDIEEKVTSIDKNISNISKIKDIEEKVITIDKNIHVINKIEEKITDLDKKTSDLDSKIQKLEIYSSQNINKWEKITDYIIKIIIAATTTIIAIKYGTN